MKIPKNSSRPIAKWTHRKLSLQMIADGVFDAIRGRWIGKWLRRTSIRLYKGEPKGVSDGGDGKNADWGVWIEPTLSR